MQRIQIALMYALCVLLIVGAAAIFLGRGNPFGALLLVALTALLDRGVSPPAIQTTYLLYLATNPRNACRVRMYREHFVRTRAGWIPDRLEEIGEAMSRGQEVVVTPKKVREIIKASQQAVSLETPIGEEEDSHLGDFIEDRGALAPAEAASHQLLKEQVEAVLDSLTGRERRVLQLRFGLEDGRARTLEEVGKEFNVTRERIRQIEAKALRKLRHPSRSRKLRDYLEE